MPIQTIYSRDSDHDGLSDAQELALGTNPFSSDSDSDGQTDLEEVQRGGDALSPARYQKELSDDLEL